MKTIVGRSIKLGILSLITMSLSAFSISTPFNFPQGKNKMAVNARLTLTHAYIREGKSDAFYKHSEEVVASLRQRPGILAYSVRRQLFGNQAWTLTLWDTEANKQQFISSKEHQAAMSQASILLTCARFLRIEWSGVVRTLDWDELIRRIGSEGQEYAFGSKGCPTISSPTPII